MTRFAASRAVVDLSAYAHNLAVVREAIPPACRIMAVVKADAYGHGLVPIANRAVEAGCAMLGVACVDEGLALRDAGVAAPIVVLTRPHEEGIRAAVAAGLRLTISDLGTAKLIGEYARKANKIVPVHCKVDTGMGRQGFAPNRFPDDAEYITRLSHIDIEAVCTHFPVADEPENPFNAAQLKLFKQVVKQCERQGLPHAFVHAANSPAVVTLPGAAFDMVRPGLMTYGVWPTASPPDDIPLRPVLRWETRIVLIKQLDAGHSVGYGATYTAARPTRMALLPVGYADGYRFALANRADVLIRGKRCPVIGRISMDQMAVDITQLPEVGVAVGDTATLIGEDGDEAITAAELAERAGTIPYDILTGIGRRVDRVYTG